MDWRGILDVYSVEAGEIPRLGRSIFGAGGGSQSRRSQARTRGIPVPPRLT
jgi:hypothetical protein